MPAHSWAYFVLILPFMSSMIVSKAAVVSFVSVQVSFLRESSAAVFADVWSDSIVALDVVHQGEHLGVHFTAELAAEFKLLFPVFRVNDRLLSNLGLDVTLFFSGWNVDLNALGFLLRHVDLLSSSTLPLLVDLIFNSHCIRFEKKVVYRHTLRDKYLTFLILIFMGAMRVFITLRLLVLAINFTKFVN